MDWQVYELSRDEVREALRNSLRDVGAYGKDCKTLARRKPTEEILVVIDARLDGVEASMARSRALIDRIREIDRDNQEQDG